MHYNVLAGESLYCLLVWSHKNVYIVYFGLVSNCSVKEKFTIGNDKHLLF